MTLFQIKTGEDDQPRLWSEAALKCLDRSEQHVEVQITDVRLQS